ncbi:reticulon-like protein B16 isoform X2 [Musa acuminata AAA Group]|uniref:reticulon-like protein B16 isoform X2 n=1 Tax=Musa acuminata AAA Group TaxID=214697 RepID=UPI0031E0996C
MEGSVSDPSNGEIAAEGRKESALDQCYRLFNRQRSIHQIIGGGKGATIAWFLFERSGLSFLTICSDILLILIVIQFARANSAVLLDKQLQPLPELVLSEEMVNNAAASFRVKINNMLMMAHDITLGKDFRIFFQVVVILWLLSVVGSFFSFFTLAYIGIIVSFTIPALYDKYEDRVDRYAGMVHRKISKHYKIVDENVIRRLPRRFSKSKDA